MGRIDRRVQLVLLCEDTQHELSFGDSWNEKDGPRAACESKGHQAGVGQPSSS